MERMLAVYQHNCSSYNISSKLTASCGNARGEGRVRARKHPNSPRYCSNIYYTLYSATILVGGPAPLLPFGCPASDFTGGMKVNTLVPVCRSSSTIQTAHSFYNPGPHQHLFQQQIKERHEPQHLFFQRIFQFILCSFDSRQHHRRSQHLQRPETQTPQIEEYCTA